MENRRAVAVAHARHNGFVLGVEAPARAERPVSSRQISRNRNDGHALLAHLLVGLLVRDQTLPVREELAGDVELHGLVETRGGKGLANRGQLRLELVGHDVHTTPLVERPAGIPHDDNGAICGDRPAGRQTDGLRLLLGHRVERKLALRHSLLEHDLAGLEREVGVVRVDAEVRVSGQDDARFGERLPELRRVGFDVSDVWCARHAQFLSLSTSNTRFTTLETTDVALLLLLC